MEVCSLFEASPMSSTELHATRGRLRRLWSAFRTDYTVAIGPTWTCLPWPIDTDLEPVSGARLVSDTLRFITPGNVLGIPGVALPTGVADGLATGIQIYGELFREDLCFLAAEIIERDSEMPTPIDPVAM